MFLYHLSCQAILRSYGSEVEHFLGKEEVAGSSPAMSSTGLCDFNINGTNFVYKYTYHIMEEKMAKEKF